MEESRQASVELMGTADHTGCGDQHSLQFVNRSAGLTLTFRGGGAMPTRNGGPSKPLPSPSPFPLEVGRLKYS